VGVEVDEELDGEDDGEGEVEEVEQAREGAGVVVEGRLQLGLGD